MSLLSLPPHLPPQLQKQSLYNTHFYPPNALPSHHQICSINSPDLRNDWPQLLQISIGSRDLSLGLAIHAFLVKFPTPNDAFQGNNLINMYVKLKRLNDARQVFDEMPIRNTITWTSLMNGYSQVKDPESVFRMAHDMFLSGNDFSEQTCTVVLRACGAPGGRVLGEQIHGLAIKREFDNNIFVGTSLISMYSRNNSLNDAERVFENISGTHDIQCFNTMIVEYGNNGDGKSAVRVLCDVINSGLEPSDYTFTSAISACTSNSGVEEGLQVHGLAIKYGYADVTTVGNAVITMYGKHGFADEAEKMFCEMGGKNLVSWTALLSGYAKNGDGSKAMSLFVEMLNMGINLDSSCLAAVIDGCSECMDFSLELQIHGLVIKFGFVSDVCVGTALVDQYARSGDLRSARLVFSSLSYQSIVSFNAILLGYIKTDGYEEEDCLNLLMKLRSSGVKPDEITFSRLISLSANQASIGKGKSLHAYAIKAGVEDDLIVSNAMVTMYAKCGSIRDANDVFNAMIDRDLVTWNAMISAHALHGQRKKALCLFEEMKREVTPDDMTMLAVLQACSYSGFFGEGFHLFEEMESKYKIKPVMEHYACMVDLLGRAGFLSKAMDFIESSPFVDSPLLWRTLVNACKVNGDTNFGRVASKRLLGLVQEHAASYILVSNMYAASGLFHEAAETRRMLNDQKLSKEAGCSWIEIENKVHRFVASGKDHQESKQIYMILDVVTAQTKEGWNAEAGPKLASDR